jgi:hypothetical protein
MLSPVQPCGCVDPCATASDVNDHGHRVKEMALQADKIAPCAPKTRSETHDIHFPRPGAARGCWRPPR